MKSAAERGRIGAWAYEARADADLSVEEVAERLARAGQPVQPATIRGIEGGSKQPSRRLLRAMATVYGSNPPGDESAAPSTVTDEGAALQHQITVLMGLVSRLQAEADDRETRVRAVEAELAELRDPPRDGASPTRSAPHATRG